MRRMGNVFDFMYYSIWQIRNRVGKFEKFIKENDAKRRRAIQKYQTELKLKDQKTRELDSLWQEMEQLKSK